MSTKRTSFLVYLEDLEERWARKNKGGTVTGKKKIFCLTFADNVATILDMPEGLQNMIGDLDKFCKESGMEVNGKETKIMVFRKGKRRSDGVEGR